MKLLIDLTYDSHADLLKALNAIKAMTIPEGEFKSVRAGYAAKCYHSKEQEIQPQLINGKWHQIVKSSI